MHTLATASRAVLDLMPASSTVAVLGSTGL